MRRDPQVFCIGEDIGVPGGWGGAFTVTIGLDEQFPGRIINTPIAELGFFGVAVGAAVMGMRPIADVQYGDHQQTNPPAQRVGRPSLALRAPDVGEAKEYFRAIVQPQPSGGMTMLWRP